MGHPRKDESSTDCGGRALTKNIKQLDCTYLAGTPQDPSEFDNHFNRLARAYARAGLGLHYLTGDALCVVDRIGFRVVHGMREARALLAEVAR